MDLTFKIEGLDALKTSSRSLTAAIEKELAIALDASGRYVVAEAKKSILQGGKTGRIYRRGTVIHRASAPGQAPASDTGRLVNSIASYLERGALYAVVTAGRGLAKYARALEYGTVKMAARPFFIPAVEKSRAWIGKRLSSAIERAIRTTLRK